MDAAGLEQAPAGLCFQQLVLQNPATLFSAEKQLASGAPQGCRGKVVFLRLAVLFSVRLESSKFLGRLL